MTMIRRHSAPAVFMHWCNACCWLLLTFTGFALLANPEMQPVGRWWSDLWHDLFGGLGLLRLHIFAGLFWLAAYIVYILARCKADVLPFLREILAVRPAADLRWCGLKALWLTIGPRGMRRLGLSGELPPQGFYNAGQRLVALIAVVCGVMLALTGLVLLFLSGASASASALRWCLLLHFCSAGVMAVLIPVHIYMAALAPGEGPALRSMLTGMVPLAHAREHNPLWARRLEAEDRRS